MLVKATEKGGISRTLDSSSLVQRLPWSAGKCCKRTPNHVQLILPLARQSLVAGASRAHTGLLRKPVCRVSYSEGISSKYSVDCMN